MRIICLLGCVGYLLGATAFAQSPVTLTINARSPGYAIPSDFTGLSFETSALQYNSSNVDAYLFDSSNTQLLTLFRNLGIKNLRIGGGSVDENKAGYVPASKDIDALFRFVKAADLNVIYSVRLLKGDPAQDASAAKYVWDNYEPCLKCFAIGNEPNLYKERDPEITNDTSFVVKWSRFATAITNVVPDAKFGGPDNGTGGTTWASTFADAEKNSGIVTSFFAHYYVGGGNGRRTSMQLIDQMLSSNWDVSKYPAYYDKIGAKAAALGLPYRLTELNSYVAPYPGAWGANNCFATALFALDCMHWWAAHGCRGVNFHTVVGKYNGTICRDANGDYQVYPIGYGIKAFDLGGHGNVMPLTISNMDGTNLALTAYAVSNTTNLYVTIINKEHGANARDARVTILPEGIASKKAETMFLTGANGRVEATNGITLGGAPITNNAPWQGQWKALASVADGHCTVIVPAASAAIVKISAR